MAADLIFGLKVQSILLLGGILLVCLVKITDSKIHSSKVKYSGTDTENADVYIFRYIKRKEGYYKYTFRRSIGDAWEYQRNTCGIKNRILLFFGGYAVNMLLWAFECHDPIEPLAYLIGALYWGFIAFVTLITDPLEAYCVLREDRRKRNASIEDKESGFNTSDAAIVAFLQAIANCDEAEIADCFPTKCMIGKELQAEIDELLKKLKQNRDFGIIFPFYRIGLSVDISPEQLESLSVSVEETDKAKYTYVDFSLNESENGYNREIFKGSYCFETIRWEGKWYINYFCDIDKEDMTPEN